MGKGIREMAMSPESEEKQEVSFPGYHSYPYKSRGYSDRYDGNYDAREYLEKTSKEIEEEERKDLIEIKLNITYKELGKNYIDDDGIVFNNDQAELKAKEMAYDKLTEMLGKGFESKYEISKIDPTDYYECFEVDITLSPIQKTSETGTNI